MKKRNHDYQNALNALHDYQNAEDKLTKKQTHDEWFSFFYNYTEKMTPFFLKKYNAPFEVNEIISFTWEKFNKALEANKINYSEGIKAYITRIIRNQIIDLLRKHNNLKYVKKIEKGEKDLFKRKYYEIPSNKKLSPQSKIEQKEESS